MMACQAARCGGSRRFRKEVWEAYKQVKANKGVAGVDDQSIEDFEKKLKKNLYKIWNWMNRPVTFRHRSA
jgi:retron-type reverse transcriptase